MYQSRWGYYADFVVFPIAALLLTCLALRSPHSHFLAVYFLSFLAGLTAWTLLEYVMHRFVFHALPLIVQMHERHHANPGALVGMPSWLTLAGFVVLVFVPLSTLAGLEVASGAVGGLMIGFTGYVAIHDAIHRTPLQRGSLLYRAKLRHVHHHAGRQDGNFGVTTGFWDRVLGTVVTGDTVR
jgi:sterol desaturase/sphingolipid hydroxylase (fatty acid hydroxylase superfamily)